MSLHVRPLQSVKGLRLLQPPTSDQSVRGARDKRLFTWPFSSSTRHSATVSKGPRYAEITCKLTIQGHVIVTRPCTITATSLIADLNRFVLLGSVNLEADPRQVLRLVASLTFLRSLLSLSSGPMYMRCRLLKHATSQAPPCRVTDHPCRGAHRHSVQPHHDISSSSRTVCNPRCIHVSRRGASFPLYLV